MNKLTIIIILTFCIILCGCVPSLNPLYTENESMTLPGLEGKWIDQDEVIWEFQKSTEKSYLLTYSKNSGNEEMFDVNLVNLNKQIFMDLSPQNGDSVFRSKDGLMRIHYVPSHTFSKIFLTGDNLYIGMLNPEWLGKIKDEGKLNIKYEEIDNGILITAKTKDLQRFISAYAFDSAAFEKPAFYLTRYKEKEEISVSTTTTMMEEIVAVDTSTTTNQAITSQDTIISVVGKGISSANPTLYFAPLSRQVYSGQIFELHIIMDNPRGIPLDDIGLWIRYNNRALNFLSMDDELLFDMDSTFISGWTPVVTYHYPATGDIFLRFKAKEMNRLLTGVIGKLKFESTGKVPVSQIQFRFNSWNSLPNTFMTYHDKDILGKARDHRDGTIGAMIRVIPEPGKINK